MSKTHENAMAILRAATYRESGWREWKVGGKKVSRLPAKCSFSGWNFAFVSVTGNNEIFKSCLAKRYQLRSTIKTRILNAIKHNTEGN